ncbi:MAG: hypothetical protein ACYS9X_22170, partial [Planctomycetota bacterium]
EALGREDDFFHRDKVVRAIAELGGFTDDEMAASIRAYAVHYASPEGEQETEDAITTIIYRKTVLPAVAIGDTVCKPEYAREEVAARLIGDAVALRRSDPKAAEIIMRVLSDWPVRAADSHCVGLVAEGRADCGIVLSLLGHRESLPGSVGDDLRALVAGGGTAGGIASALLGDSGTMRGTLAGRDREAQRALLACARLARIPLPIDRVNDLMSSADPDVAFAAERYLESEDSPEARRLVLSRHAGECRIIGAFQDDDPGWLTYLGFGAAEDHMRKQVKRPDGPEEIYALLAASSWGPCEQVFVCRRGEGAKIIVYDREGEPASRQLTKDELEGLQSFILERRVDDLAPYNIQAMDGVEYEYVHLTRAGGRRVYMNNPGCPGGEGAPVFVANDGRSTSGGEIYGEIVAIFEEFAESDELVLMEQ